MLFSGLGLLSLLFTGLGLGSVGLFGNIDLIESGIVKFDGLIMDGIPPWLVIGSLFIAIGIPLITHIYFELKNVVFKPKTHQQNLYFQHDCFVGFKYSLFNFYGYKFFYERKRFRRNCKYESLQLLPQDTLFIKMKGNLNYTVTPFKHNTSKIIYDENDNKILYDSNVDVKFNHTSDNAAYIRISKWTYAYDEKIAREQSHLINYDYDIKTNQISLDSYLLAPIDLKRSISWC